MSTTTRSSNFDTSGCSLLEIESTFTRGFAGIQMVGNPSETCREGKDRAKAALEFCGLPFPQKRLLISLTPGDIKKDGSQLDLPIAISLALLLKKQPPAINPKNWLFASEVSITGALKPVKGCIPMAISAITANLEGIVLASENAQEVENIHKFGLIHLPKMTILGFHQLIDVINWLFTGTHQPTKAPSVPQMSNSKTLDFDDMILSSQQKRLALCIASGFHNTILRGSPGSGKSMLAQRMGSILPQMTKKQHIEALQIYSSNMSHLPYQLLKGQPPFRSPHHQSSPAAVLGTPDFPGELSLAHGGILFLDEVTEFRRDLLESLREPLETATIQVSRAKKKVTWHADVLLIVACNNCPCGWLGSEKKLCSCPQNQISHYLRRISGPILDRMDIQFQTRDPADLNKKIIAQLLQHSPNQTKELKDKVVATHEIAQARNREFGVYFNRDIRTHHIGKALRITASTLSKWVDTLFPTSLSPRSIVKCFRVSRTLADLDHCETVQEKHVKEALQFQFDPSRLLGV